MRGATIGLWIINIPRGVSIHAPHAGRDPLWKSCAPRKRFQSTRPMRGATQVCYSQLLHCVVSIHAPHAGRDVVVLCNVRPPCVSIHAPHAGRDQQLQLAEYTAAGFNPRAPCWARLLYLVEHPQADHVSIHAPHAGRDATFAAQAILQRVSIHAPHAGRDTGHLRHRRQQGVSIHAPRAGRDWQRLQKVWLQSGFNPRAPCGARPYELVPFYMNDKFQSTRPVRGATPCRLSPT